MTSTLKTARLLALALFISNGLEAQRITRRESRGEVRNQVTVETVVAAINNSARVSARLANLGAFTSERIRIIDVRPFIARARRGSYVATLEKNVERIEALRADLVAQDPVVRALADRRPSLTVDAVVAAGILDVMETGKSFNVLVLYVDNGNALGTASSGNRSVATFRPTSAGVLSALQVSPEMVARVSALASLRLDRVRFYDISAFLQPTDADSYRAALRRNETAIRSLRAELSKRPLVLQAMARHDATLTLGDIFAADILGEEDALVLYYQRRTVADAPGGT
ncbi:MAG: hypothetical protein ACT4P6_21285 [Gemmatimonadaceae bacterium]